MKVVIDTNVLVSGIFFKGIPSKVLQAWFNHEFTVFATPLIIEEYLRVIDHLCLSKNPIFKHDWSVVLPEICHLIQDQKSDTEICRDQADDKFILCAACSGSEYLVSGDIDLKALEEKFIFKIVSPRNFLNILRERS